MNEFIGNYAKRLFRLSWVDVGDYATIKSKGMRFDTTVYDVKDMGRLFLMSMKAPGGAMRMETATFTPLELEGPILSADEVLAFGQSTLVLELYDTTATHPDFHALDEVKRKYASLPAYDPGAHPYYRLRLPESDYKKGRGIKRETGAMADEYCAAYFQRLQDCSPIDPAEKKLRNAEFSESLFQSGGPAVNQFKQMIGEGKTREFLLKYMFCSM